VTGTDTGCGKTTVALALCRAARAAGLRVRVLKPVETGCELRDGEAWPADAVALARAAADDAPIGRLCPYRLRLPAAPEAAARLEGVQIELAPIAAALALARRDSDLVLVEGAGGLRVPIAPGLDMAGLARRLALPLLVVARASLGTINHTLLTLEVARGEGLRVLGVVVNHSEPEVGEGNRRNLALLRERLPVPELAELRHGATELVPPIDARALVERCARG
jgi:dethiobiotin synthetase